MKTFLRERFVLHSLVYEADNFFLYSQNAWFKGYFIEIY